MSSAHTTEGRGEMRAIARQELARRLRLIRSATSATALETDVNQLVGARSMAHRLGAITPAEVHRIGAALRRATVRGYRSVNRRSPCA